MKNFAVYMNGAFQYSFPAYSHPPVSVWNAYGDYMGYKTGWGYHRLKEQQGVRKPPADTEGYFMSLIRDNTVPITLPLDSRHFG
jgi:hypothetical protein